MADQREEKKDQQSKQNIGHIAHGKPSLDDPLDIQELRPLPADIPAVVAKFIAGVMRDPVAMVELEKGLDTFLQLTPVQTRLADKILYHQQLTRGRQALESALSRVMGLIG